MRLTVLTHGRVRAAAGPPELTLSVKHCTARLCSADGLEVLRSPRSPRPRSPQSPRSPRSPQSSKSSSSKSSAVKGESDQDTPCGGVGSGPAGWFAVEGSPGSGLCFLLLLPAAPSSFCLVCTSCSAPPAHPAAFGGCSSIIAKLIALLCRFVGVRRAPVGAPPSVGGGRAVVGGALALLAFLHARAQPNTTNTHAATHDHNMHTLNLQSSCKWRSSAC